jgi:hypothetical protein
MEPRLSSSKKWTPLPTELRALITELLAETFSGPAHQKLGPGRWIVEGQIFEKEMLLRIGYLPQGGLKQNNFEISIEHLKKPMEVVHTALDAAAALFNEFLAAQAPMTEDGELDEKFEENMDLPRHWKKFVFSGVEVWMQHSTVNSDLEAQANALLGLADEGLVRGSDED